MRWMTLTVLMMGCATASTQAAAAPAQAKLHLPDAGLQQWTTPNPLECTMIDNLGIAYNDSNGRPQVGRGYEAKKAPGNGAPAGPGHPDRMYHGDTPNHSSTQRLALDPGPDLGQVSLRMDSNLLVSAMSGHHKAGTEAFVPTAYRFQLFLGDPKEVTPNHVKASGELQIDAVQLASGRFKLSAVLPGTATANAKRVLVVRASSPSHNYQSPQLVCVLPAPPR